MWVPYCSSDEHAGNRDASAETANLHFNGKNIVSDVVDQLMAHPLAGQVSVQENPKDCNAMNRRLRKS